MKRQRVSAGVCVVGAGVMLTITLTGCDLFGGGNRITELPAEVVIWSDPDPDNEDTYWSIRDVNDDPARFVVIGTGGEVQFNIGKVCNVCDVDGATIAIDGTPRMNIRFGLGPDGTGPRRPFLVATDGFYIELVSEGDSITFQEEDLRFEENDNSSDDLAQPVGVIPNPTLNDEES